MRAYTALRLHGWMGLADGKVHELQAHLISALEHRDGGVGSEAHYDTSRRQSSHTGQTQIR
jgi:hypothetical protein